MTENGERLRSTNVHVGAGCVVHKFHAYLHKIAVPGSSFAGREEIYFDKCHCGDMLEFEILCCLSEHYQDHSEEFCISIKPSIIVLRSCMFVV